MTLLRLLAATLRHLPRARACTVCGGRPAPRTSPPLCLRCLADPTTPGADQ